MDVSYYKEKFEPIDGKWYITQKLGSGAFGTVLEVERRDHTNMKAAVKIVSIPPTSSQVESYREENYDLDEESISTYFYGFVEEFTKEIQLMSELRGCSNVVVIEDYDVKKANDGIGWDIFIRMELLTPMNKYFRDNIPTTREVIKVGIDICKALEACQEYQIIHRDIKPSNIFVSKNGDYKLGDFGVSRTLEKTMSGLSKKGTYTYMAPEVFKGEAYNSNVDIYSLGIVMYKLLNNNLEPFRKERTYSDEQNALAARLKGETIPKPANAEGRVAEIVLKACSYDPQNRYTSPMQMRMDLEEVLYNDKQTPLELGVQDEENLEKQTNAIDKGIQLKGDSICDDDKTVSIFGRMDTSESDNFQTDENSIEEENESIIFNDLESINDTSNEMNVSESLNSNLADFNDKLKTDIELEEKIDFSRSDVEVDKSEEIKSKGQGKFIVAVLLILVLLVVSICAPISQNGGVKKKDMNGTIVKLSDFAFSDGTVRLEVQCEIISTTEEKEQFVLLTNYDENQIALTCINTEWISSSIYSYTLDVEKRVSNADIEIELYLVACDENGDYDLDVDVMDLEYYYAR